ncbi:S26 family signal peptidase [Sphingomonas sp. TX0522]|uniref:S26 family signal peptidase n=1 Tax=Sphingomonas sp. TX0522 TaxID=2479205 RepID=UPI0018E064EC|nr:S26 family signal peptidase [Sphingomonas sp. TX0522]MBI0530290.1 S26 family signal peptidase [Sphingomonas sp. TX0522]
MTRQGWLQVTLSAAGLIAVTALINPPPRLIWNATASVPTGLYAIRQAGEPRLGELVAVMPPEPLAGFLADGGYLPRGVPLLKHIAALPGQRVCRVDEVVTVDGRRVGLARERDRIGRVLPSWSGCRAIVHGELFLMNTAAPDSLDGRYFGPLPANSVLGSATPLWTDHPRLDRAAAGQRQ